MGCGFRKSGLVLKNKRNRKSGSVLTNMINSFIAIRMVIHVK